MSTKVFIIRLGFFAAFVAALIFLQAFIPPIAIYTKLGWMTWAFFVLFIATLYGLGKLALRTPMQRGFDRLLLSVNFIKMFSAILFIFSYIKMEEPPTHGFLIPFFVIYFLFTIFEVDMLSKLSKEQLKS